MNFLQSFGLGRGASFARKILPSCMHMRGSLVLCSFVKSSGRECHDTYSFWHGQDSLWLGFSHLFLSRYCTVFRAMMAYLLDSLLLEGSADGGRSIGACFSSFLGVGLSSFLLFSSFLRFLRFFFSLEEEPRRRLSSFSFFVLKGFILESLWRVNFDAV